MVTLSKAELRSELGITSLPARRYLWDLIKGLKKEQETSDYSAAITAHEEEIQELSASPVPTGQGPDAASGGLGRRESLSAVVTVLQIDAQRQRRVIEDQLFAHRMQKAMKTGQEVYEDAELAREEQERLNQLYEQAESDLLYAESLASGRERAAVSVRRQAQAPHQHLVEPQLGSDHRGVNRISSLFGLSIQSCATNKINVAEAFRTGKMKPITEPTIVTDDDTEDSEEEDSKPAYSFQVGKSPFTTLPFVEQCNVCYDDGVKGYHLACGHLQCTRCTKKLFKAALKDSSLLPLRCCEIPIDMNISSQLLKRKDAAILLQRVEEIEATNKMYCPSCNCFLNLDLLDTTMTLDLRCDCGTELCTGCKTEAHFGMTCQQNRATKRGADDLVLDLARGQGWKQCPGCSMMIELRSGCNHMTCAYCRHEFCYNCLKHWNSRTATCSSGQCQLWEEDRLLEAGEARVLQEEAARGAALAPAIRRARLLEAQEELQANEVCIHDWRRRDGYHGDCPNCGFTMWAYGMHCRSECRSTVCYTCAHHRIPQRGWR